MRLGSIQFLRMFAALLIAYLHAIGTQVYTPPGFQEDMARGINEFGIGVDIFFVISGFIIALTAGSYDGWRQSLHFLKKRFIRLNPVYYIALLLFLAVNFHHMWKTHIPGYGSFLKAILLLPVADTIGWLPSVMPVAWTLNFEWYFYILFALAIAIPIKNKHWFLILLCSALVACYAIAGVTASRVWFITNPIMLEFLMGIAIFLWYRRSTPPPRIAYGLLIGGVALALYDILRGTTFVNDVYGTAEGRIALLRMLHMGIPAALLVAGCLFLEKNGLLAPLWNNRYVQLLGNASYSIYLIHYITYSALAALFLRLGPVLNINLSISLWFLIATVSGILFYRYVEEPLLQRLGRITPGAPVSC
jgi:exopolysaccharide production protein ExoZ